MSRPPQAHAKPKVNGLAERDDQALRLPTLQEARKALEDHLATFPGTHEECYGHPEKERARQFFLERKAVLQTAVEAAERSEASRWKPVDVSTLEQKNAMTAKKPFEEVLAGMQARLARYVADDNRRNASNLRSQIRVLCEENGHPVPALMESKGGRQGRGGRSVVRGGPSVAAPVPAPEPMPDLTTAIQNCAEAFATTPEAIARAVEASTYRSEPPEAVAACCGLIARARGLVWRVLESLEELPRAQRIACASEVEALIDAAQMARRITSTKEIAC